MLYRLPTSGQPPLRSLTSRIRRWFSQHSPPGLPGGAASTTQRHRMMYRRRPGSGPTATAGTSANIRKSGTDRNVTERWQVRGNGIEGIKPAKSRRREEEWPKKPLGPMSRGAKTGRQCREPRTTEQPSRNPPQSSNHGHHLGRCPACCRLGSPGNHSPGQRLVISTMAPTAVAVA